MSLSILTLLGEDRTENITYADIMYDAKAHLPNSNNANDDGKTRIVTWNHVIYCPRVHPIFHFTIQIVEVRMAKGRLWKCEWRREDSYSHMESRYLLSSRSPNFPLHDPNSGSANGGGKTRIVTWNHVILLPSRSPNFPLHDPNSESANDGVRNRVAHTESRYSMSSRLPPFPVHVPNNAIANDGGTTRVEQTESRYLLSSRGPERKPYIP
ncbi:hypothetical protein J6590_038382 [Homalodisca vitripennis]|nr:hypothetical protein J6590_038382 [Homalodisca vitripennis]